MTIAYHVVMKRIPAVILTMFFLNAAAAKGADDDRALLEWAHNAPQAAGISAPEPTATPAPQPKSTKPKSSETKLLFVERDPDLSNQPAQTKSPTGIIGLARSAEHSVTFTGSLLGRACKGFARTTRATIDGKPQYMRPDERTARYNNNYRPGANDPPYSELQTGAKTIRDVMP
jgi:hypothetical protein